MRSEARQGARIFAARAGDGVSRPPLLSSASARWRKNRARNPGGQGVRSEAQPEKGRASVQQERGTASAVPLSCRLRPHGGGRTAARNPGGQGVRSEAQPDKGRASLQQERGRRQPPPSLVVCVRAAVEEPHPEPRRAGRALRGPARQGARIFAAGKGDGVSRPLSCRLRPRGGRRTAPRTPAGRACAPRSSPRRGAHPCSPRGDGVSRPPSCHPPQRGGGRTAPRTPAGRACAPRPSPRRGAHLCSRRGGRRQPSPLLPSAPARRWENRTQNLGGQGVRSEAQPEKGRG